MLAFSALFLALPFTVFAGNHHAVVNRHHDLAKRSVANDSLSKRQSFTGERWTWYDVSTGAGACGIQNYPSQFTVALNSAQFGGGFPGPNCFKSITMTANGKTATATIMDECPGCPYGGLDLTFDLFNYFGGDGVITGDWYFNGGMDFAGNGGSPGGGSAPTTSSSTWVAPTTSSTYSPPPTSTWSPPPTTTSSTSTSTWSSSSSSSWSSSSSTTQTSSSSSSSSAHSTSSVNYSSGPASGLAVPTGVVTTNPGEGDTLNSLNQAFVGLGAIAVAAAST